MAKTQFLQYTIHLPDRQQVETLQGGQHDPGQAVGAVLKSPDQAAIDYAAPKLTGSAPFRAPCITSPWFNGDNNYPQNVATFDRKSGGWFGIPLLFGTTTHFYWRGIFAWAPSDTPAPGDPTPETIRQRRWIDGFELPVVGEGGTGSANDKNARLASRHPQGYGYAYRNSTAVRTHKTDDFFGPQPSSSWERIYIRPRINPDIPKTIWLANSAPSIYYSLVWLPSGQIAVYVSGSVSPSAAVLLVTLPALQLETWTRVDVLVRFGTGAKIKVFYNGVLQTDTTANSAYDVATTGRLHAYTQIGGSENAKFAIDFDDWFNAEQPSLFTGPDWLHGSRMALISPSGFAIGNDWTGDWKLLLQRPVTLNATATYLTNNVSNALLRVQTDASLEVSKQPGAFGTAGIVALVVSLYAYRASGTANIQLGYALTGGSLVLTTFSQTTGLFAWYTVLYAPIALTTPVDVRSLEIGHTHSADTILESVQSFFAVGEILGIYGNEDVIPDPLHPGTPKAQVPVFGIHNAPYPRTPWAISKTPPLSPVIVVGGTYVGDANGLTLPFRAPVHFWWVRRVTTLGAGAHWWSSMNGAHQAFANNPKPEVMVEALIDPAFIPAGTEDSQAQQTILRITGAQAEANNPGDTYQYVAFCDPGMRFLLNGALTQHLGTVDVDTKLIDSKFLPEVGFFHMENDQGSQSGVSQWFKGIGHATASISKFDATETANALSFTQGHLTSKSAFHAIEPSAQQIAYSVWRRDDGSKDPGIPRVLQLATYTGDGSASRTINFAPASGRRPLWAMVVPHNAATVIRDASHTGTTSTQLPATNLATTGITGGAIDAISVGSALNANGIVYDVFVIPGDSTAGNGGFSPNGEFVPVEPTSPTGDQFEETPPDPTTVPPEEPSTEPGAPAPVPPDEPDDFGVNCIAATTRIVNIALARIGNSQQIVNIQTDTTAEAVQARLHYAEAVAQTLRDVPWPFATKITPLTVVLGTSVSANADWRWSYRQPTDCIFERRLVVHRTGAVDPTPPPFQLSSDATGGLIFTNEASAVLEYTFRPACPAGRGDPLFRDALEWKLAAMMAPALSRVAETVTYAQTRYEAALEYARAVIAPGAPGEVPAAATIDTSAASQAANVSVANRALIRIGANTIRNLATDQSREATSVRAIFEDELRATLRDFPWAFATAYASPLTLVSGSTTTPANDDWTYSYRVPTNLVFARRLVTANKRAYDASPPTFRLASDATGGLLFTEEEDAILEYTSRPDGAVAIADPLFRDALAWRLAASLAPSLAQARPELPEQIGRGPESPTAPKERPTTLSQLRKLVARDAWLMYQNALTKARTAAANEQQQDITGPDAPWISGRN